jgi:alkylmercury lyase
MAKLADGSPVPDLQAAEVRPGVFRPDWSVVTSTAARNALAGRAAARSALLEAWAHPLGRDEDQVWRCVLRLYAKRGHPPLPGDIAAAEGIIEDDVQVLLQRLQLKDLLGLEPATGTIRFAYPFSQPATGHQVFLRGRCLNALCAIDALGVGAMYGTDVEIKSSCRACDEPIRVTTMTEGREVLTATPGETVVWYDFAYEGGAAGSCCRTTAFFCSHEHLRGWLAGRSQGQAGAALALDEALEVGRALFGPILSAPARLDVARG